MKVLTIAAVVAMVVTTAAAEPRAVSLIKHYANQYGVPANVAIAVGKVESGLRCNVGGKYIGPLQISYRSARGLGYKGSNRQLRSSCDQQVKYGIKHLALSLKLARGNVRKMICKHQVGPGSRCSGNNSYTKKVLRHL